MPFKITPKMFAAVAPRADAETWAPALNAILPLWGIDTEERVFAFLAQCAHESAGFTVFEENLNYSESALNRVFSKYFKNRSAKNYARQPEKIANVVYANRMGNGPIKSGDGWKHRGRGIIQLTGKNNYAAFAEALAIDIDEAIEYIEDMTGRIESACWFWKTNNLNRHADSGNFKALSKAINGGYNGLEDRIKYWEKLKQFGSVPVTPSSPISTNMTTVGIGDRGDSVAAVQQALGITADGIFGPNTHRAVKAFQRSKGLVADGVVGPRTIAALGL